MCSREDAYVPLFTPHDPVAYFCRVEHWFKVRNITSPHWKAHLVISTLQEEVRDNARGVISFTCASNYEALKNDLILMYKPNVPFSCEQLTQLREQQLGDRTPTEHLQHMRSLIGPNQDDWVFYTIWWRHLPETVRDALEAHKYDPPDFVAALADHIMAKTNDDIAENFQHSVVNEPHEVTTCSASTQEEPASKEQTEDLTREDSNSSPTPVSSQSPHRQQVEYTPAMETLEKQACESSHTTKDALQVPPSSLLPLDKSAKEQFSADAGADPSTHPCPQPREKPIHELSAESITISNDLRQRCPEVTRPYEVELTSLDDSHKMIPADEDAPGYCAPIQVSLHDVRPENSSGNRPRTRTKPNHLTTNPKTAPTGPLRGPQCFLFRDLITGGGVLWRPNNYLELGYPTSGRPPQNYLRSSSGRLALRKFPSGPPSRKDHSQALQKVHTADI